MGTVAHGDFFLGGQSGWVLGLFFFLNRAALLMGESRGCNLWHLIASSLSEGVCVIRLLV